MLRLGEYLGGKYANEVIVISNVIGGMLGSREWLSLSARAGCGDSEEGSRFAGPAGGAIGFGMAGPQPLRGRPCGFCRLRDRSMRKRGNGGGYLDVRPSRGGKSPLQGALRLMKTVERKWGQCVLFSTSLESGPAPDIRRGCAETDPSGLLPGCGISSRPTGSGRARSVRTARRCRASVLRRMPAGFGAARLRRPPQRT